MTVAAAISQEVGSFHAGCLLFLRLTRDIIMLASKVTTSDVSIAALGQIAHGGGGFRHPASKRPLGGRRCHSQTGGPQA